MAARKKYSRDGRTFYSVACAVTKAEHDKIHRIAARNGMVAADLLRAGLRAQVRLLEEFEKRPPLSAGDVRKSLLAGLERAREREKGVV